MCTAAGTGLKTRGTKFGKRRLEEFYPLGFRTNACSRRWRRIVIPRGIGEVDEDGVTAAGHKLADVPIGTPGIDVLQVIVR